MITNPARTLRRAIAAVLAACTLAAAQTPTLLRDVNQTPVLPRDSYPFHGFALGGWYYFTADSPAAGRELYRTDGSPANTTLIDLEPGLAGSRFQGDFYPGLTRTYFFRDDGTHGTELWRTDGTVAGTTLVKDLEPGQASKNFSASVAHVLGDLFLFTTLDEGQPVTRLWASDGTAAGTVELVPPTGVIPQVPMVRFGARVVLLWSTPTSGNELWVTDGTPSGTTMLVDVNPGAAGSDPWEINAIGNQLIFSGRDAARGREVWITDGTQAGTRAIDVVPGPVGSEPRDFVALGSQVLFRAFTPTFGTELWRTDGTQSGTVLVADIRTGASVSSYPELFGVLNNGVVFAADDGLHGTEMWVSDGTAAGTRMLADLAPGATSSYAGGELTDMVQWVGNALYFISFDAISVTDGTSPGTRTIKRFVNPMSLRTLLLGGLAQRELPVQSRRRSRRDRALGD